MLSSREYLQDLGYQLTGNPVVDNLKLSMEFKIGSDSSIFVDVYKPWAHREIITRNDYQHAFMDVIWKNLTLGNKIRVLKWQMDDYLKSNGYDSSMFRLHFFPTTRENDNLTYVALAQKGAIEFNLHYLDTNSGYKVLGTAIHECIHLVDNTKFEELIEKYKDYMYTTKDFTFKNIMELPVTGTIRNIRTKSDEFVTKEMADDILLLKNLVIRLNMQKNIIGHKRHIHNKADYEKYVRGMFYYTSPVERKAHVESSKFALMVAKKNEKDNMHVDSDFRAMNVLKYIINYVGGKKREIEKSFNLNLNDAMNAELVAEYNRLMYGSQKSKYICKTMMMRREIRRIEFFERNFSSCEGIKE